jgi:asparagine synthase (glutamine-hydrolysing)
LSGIVGIVNLDGAPVDRDLLWRMTNFMKFRGPDQQRTWVGGHVGFGHTLLKTTFESEHENQPFTLDGRTWIVADARVDAQAELIAKLNANGEDVKQGVPDVELLLRSYRVWGDDCVEHLLGDFAFATWDGLRHRLFCARDHLGVKPFFYSRVGQTLLFSNTLDCLRQHPAVSEKLNDLAIADFLLFDLNQDPNTTSFADIQRIPPAHGASWSADGIRRNRYWTLPIDEPIHFKRADDYTDRFNELLDTAVSDRLRTNRIAILMSGGLDSPTLAATACKILRGRLSNCEVRAFTSVMDGFDGSERHYAGLVSQRLGIQIHFRDRSRGSNWNKTAIHTPEPVADPTNLVAENEWYRSISFFSRVLFYGEGPDNALHYEWKPYLYYLARKRQFGRLAADVCAHIVRHRRIPLIPTIPRMLKDRAHKDQWTASFPSWLDRSFESRMELRSRWAQARSSASAPSHPVRPTGYGSFQTLLWEAVFRGLDAEETKTPLETRHPFVDLRLLRYMLAVPAIPWCRAKHLLRNAMRGVLPDPVLKRPKSPFTSEPTWDEARHLGLPPLSPTRDLHKYVNSDRVPRVAEEGMVLFRINFRPFSLNYWLENMRQESHDHSKEDFTDELVTYRK